MFQSGYRGVRVMSGGQRARGRFFSLPSEAIAALILFVVVFVVLASAAISGHLPLPHI